jgi:hypothetical protein
VDFHVYVHFVDPLPVPPDPRLDQILTLLQKEQTTMAAIDDSLTTLTATVAANTTVMGSASALITGFGAQLAAAIAAAQAAGATPAELQTLTDLNTTLTANNATLTAAIASNTPAAPTIPAPAAAALAAKLA